MITATLRRLIENEIGASSNQLSPRYMVVTRNGGDINQFEIIGRNGEEIKKIKNIIEIKEMPGTTLKSSLPSFFLERPRI